MRATAEPLEGNRVKLSVEVDETEFDRAVDAAFRKIAREVRVPGFRPGKVPRRLLEARIGTEAARSEALRDALPDYYAQALQVADVDAIAPPEIDITSGRDSGPLAFDAVVEVRPQVAIPGYQGLEVTVPSPAVADEDVERQVDRLRNQYGELVVVGRPARDGDFVTIDRRVYRHDETLHEATDEVYELGSGSIVPELDVRLQGARVGDIIKFNASLPGTAAGGGPNEAAEASFSVLVKEVREKVLPALTDEWVQEASEFDTVEELRADIASRLGQVKRVQTAMAVRDEALRALVSLVDDAMPEALVETEMQRQAGELSRRLEAQGADLGQYLSATGQEPDAFVEQLRAAATESVRADLALRALADAEGLTATDDDVDAEVERIAAQLRVRPDQLRQQLERTEQVPAVRSDVRKAKALAWLVDHVGVVDTEGRPIDRDDFSPDPEHQAEEADS